MCDPFLFNQTQLTPTVAVLCQTTLVVMRDRILESSVQPWLQLKNEQLRGRLMIKFHGEEGKVNQDRAPELFLPPSFLGHFPPSKPPPCIAAITMVIGIPAFLLSSTRGFVSSAGLGRPFQRVDRFDC